MTDNLPEDLMIALCQSDKELLQAKNRIALLEQTLRYTEAELKRVTAEKFELEQAMHKACNVIDEVMADSARIAE